MYSNKVDQQFKAHVADMIQDVVNEVKDATRDQLEYLRSCMNNRLTELISSKGRQYGEEIEKGTDLYTIEEWNEIVSSGGIINDDGFGYWCKDGKESRDHVFDTPQKDATHVAWYNK